MCLFITLIITNSAKRHSPLESWVQSKIWKLTTVNSNNSASEVWLNKIWMNLHITSIILSKKRFCPVVFASSGLIFVHFSTVLGSSHGPRNIKNALKNVQLNKWFEELIKNIDKVKIQCFLTQNLYFLVEWNLHNKSKLVPGG